MVHKDPSKRISLEEIVAHPFLMKDVGNNEGFKKSLQMVDSKNLNSHQTMNESSSTQH